jgi:hypothetical protein
LDVFAQHWNVRAKSIPEFWPIPPNTLPAFMGLSVTQSGLQPI